MTGSQRAPAALAAGSVASGLLAYVLFALVTRGLGAEAAAPVSVLWTQWAFAGAAFTFPLQHWITRSVVAGREGDVRRAAGRVAGLVVAAALALGLLAWLLRDRLFHRDDAWFPVLVVLVTLGSAAVGVVRGGLAGRGRFAAVAWSLVAENALRCLLVGGLLLAGEHDPVVHGLALVAGGLVALWPSAWRFAAAGADGASALAFLGGAASGQLVAQAVLTGGPVLLALLGGSPVEVTAMFAALALFRAPYMVVLGTLPQVTQRVTADLVSGRVDHLRSLMRGLAVVTVLGVPAAGAFGALLGPWLLRLVFGSSVEVGPALAAVLAAGCTLAVANVVLMVTALAGDRPLHVGAAWAGAVLVGAVAVVALGDVAVVSRTATAFLVTEVAAAAALVIVVRQALRPRA
jgi:O-antigen/teichoic acid export membrane protein